MSIDIQTVSKLFVIALLACLLGAAGLGVWTLASNGGVPDSAGDTKRAAAPAPVPDAPEGYTDYPAPRPRVAVAVAPGEEPPPGAETGDQVPATSGDGQSARDRARASDAEIRDELNAFKRELRSAGPGVDGPRAKVLPNGGLGLDLRQRRPHVHGRRRPALRHERARVERIALAKRDAPDWRVHGRAPSRPVAATPA